jgi:hypothetical protein
LVANAFEPDNLIPDYPHFDAATWSECAASNGLGFVLFEWYRWVGNLATVTAFIEPESPDFAEISAREYHLLSGLLARCSRLMLSTIALTHNREFGEAAAIIHRSLTETAVKIMWVCGADPEERSRLMIASGLQPELEFEAQIYSNIDNRGGEKLALEERMLTSIENNFKAAGLSRNEVSASKRLPNLAVMFESIGWSRLQYVVLQRLGSHAVHGNWPSLLMDYLEDVSEGTKFRPRGHAVDAHPNLYMTGAKLVLEAISSYARICLKAPASVEFQDLAHEAHEKLMNDYERALELGL